MEDKIRIRFELTDENKNNFINESTVDVIFGDTVLNTIGEQLNAFLRQCGYMRKNDYIFMEDITDEEYEALGDYLRSLRSKEK